MRTEKRDSKRDFPHSPKKIEHLSQNAQNNSNNNNGDHISFAEDKSASNETEKEKTERKLAYLKSKKEALLKKLEEGSNSSSESKSGDDSQNSSEKERKNFKREKLLKRLDRINTKIENLSKIENLPKIENLSNIWVKVEFCILLELIITILQKN